MYCENCGTKMSDGICSQCAEELFIYEFQSEYLPDVLSDEFMGAVARQKESYENNCRRCAGGGKDER